MLICLCSLNKGVNFYMFVWIIQVFLMVLEGWPGLRPDFSVI